jgi:hypothetical protein
LGRHLDPAMIWIFLGPAVLLRKLLLFEPWICLGFLGFSRPKRDFSMGYAGQIAQYFSSRFSPALAMLEQGSYSLDASKPKIVHRASLA